jgi:hypothetical protein
MALEYETGRNSWREEFEKSYVEWVDLELIEALLESMNRSIRFLCNAIKDNTRWPSKINKTLRTVSYPRLREAADFLGIPPWLLFYHDEKNNKIRKLFESINSIHKPIHLPYFSEYESLYLDFFYELSNRVRTRTDYDVLENKLRELIGERHHHHVIAGNWKAVVSFFNEIHRDFSGGAKFYYRGPEAFLEGDVRINFATDPKDKPALIKSGWLAIDTGWTGTSSTETLYNFFATIRTDMEWVFYQQPWVFTLDSNGKQTHLLMWNSLRKSNEHYEKVAELINRKLPKARLTMNINEKGGSSLPEILRNNPFEEFIRMIKLDVAASKEPKYSRRKNSLQLLLGKGAIRNGDRITLLSSKLTRHLLHRQDICNATVVVENGKPLVKWDHDKKIYSISKLTQIILVDFGEQFHIKNQHLNGNRHWKLLNADKSLYDMAIPDK